MTPQCVKALVEYLIDHDDDINIGINDFGGLKIVFEELVGDMGCSLSYEQQEILIKKTAERFCKDLEADFEKYILNNIELFSAEEEICAKFKRINPTLYACPGLLGSYQNEARKAKGFMPPESFGKQT